MLTRFHRLFILTAALVTARAGVVHAQYSSGPAGDIGIKVSDSSVLHVGVAAEAGYDTNVFYNDNQKQQSAMIRVVPSIALTNNGRDGKPRSDVVYTLAASLVYREYLDPAVRNQPATRAFIPSAIASLLFGGAKTSLSLSDQFTRVEEAPYQNNGEPLVRDSNQASASVTFSPGGGRINVALRYTNTLDLFETKAYEYGSTLGHDGMLDVSWKWLPKTALYLQAGGGYIHFLHPESAPPSLPREDSVPVRAMAGLRGLVTPKTTVHLGVGYATAFYGSSSQNPSGLSNLAASVDVGYLPTLLSKISLGYSHGFRNSAVIGDYYDVDAVNLGIDHSIFHFVAGARAGFEYRRFHNYTVARRDAVLSAGAHLDYYISSWFYAGATYGISMDQPNSVADPLSVSYTKQQILARIGLAY